MVKKISRREFLEITGAVGLSFSLGQTKKENRPNVIIVHADQWRFSAFSHRENHGLKTINIDKLQESGIVFERTYSAYPLCTPNRSALITSRYPHSTGMIMNNLMLPPKEKGFAEIFRDAGYATHYIGKWHMDGPAKPGFVPKGWRRRGFETFEGFNRGHAYYNTKTFSNDGKLMKPGPYEPAFQVELAMEFIKKHKERPFLLFLSWGPPHTPYKPPKGFRRFFNMKELPWRENVPRKLRSKKRMRHMYAGYLGLCESLDFEFGRLIKFIEKQGLRENTIIVFTADHGDMLGSHRLFFKNHPFEESARIPLIISWPKKIKEPKRLDVLVSTIDIAPTILSLCGLPELPKAQGKDLTPFIEGKQIEISSVYCEGRMGSQNKNKSKGEWRAIVTNDYKLVLGSKGEPTHLFSLKNDPLELKNLVNDPEHKKVVKSLLKEAKKWQEKTEDPFPNPAKKAKPFYG